jgi:hypothetical protein
MVTSQVLAEMLARVYYEANGSPACVARPGPAVVEMMQTVVSPGPGVMI